MTRLTQHPPDPSPPPRRRAQHGIASLLLIAHLVGGGSLWHGSAALPVPPDRLQLRIDPNRASLAELQLLPRVGPTLARNIVAYRESVQEPAFRRPEDLDRVPRIGPATVEALRPFLTFPEADSNERETIAP